MPTPLAGAATDDGGCNGEALMQAVAASPLGGDGAFLIYILLFVVLAVAARSSATAMSAGCGSGGGTTQSAEAGGAA